ncbi:hypothetical protein FRC09_001367 [Ceratobasidium sp. 395]|nr:hypothetical protein FRC09_001367 [Ceratobasidium sp. 395]
MSATSNVFQQVFGLSLASNLVGDCTGSAAELQEKLAAALPAALQKIGPGWEVVWGPVVWKADDLVSTAQGNAWFVAKNDAVLFDDGTTRCAYVIPLAGTSGVYDWLAEDANIAQVVDLDKWVSVSNDPTPIRNNNLLPAGQTYIANGFGQAVYQLLNNSPPEGSPGYPNTLPAFLQSLPAPPSSVPAPKLVITGHSLGGALSPALAYVLLATKSLGQFTRENVLVYPTAGPSPGNTQFSMNFSRNFPPSGSLGGYQCWNTNIVNKLDIVPCAYATDPQYKPLILQNILTMLGPPPIAVIWAIRGLIYAANNLYAPIKASFFDSKFPYPPAQLTPWMQEARTQHIDAYTWEILGIAPPKDLCNASEQDKLAKYPVFSTIIRTERAVESSNHALAEAGIDERMEV